MELSFRPDTALPTGISASWTVSAANGGLSFRIVYRNDRAEEVLLSPTLVPETAVYWVRPHSATSITLTDALQYEHLSADGETLLHRDGTVGGRCLGGAFGRRTGDSVSYRIPSPAGPHRKLVIRLRGHGCYSLGGVASGEIEPDTDDFTVCTIPIGKTEGGMLPFSITCLIPGWLEIDCILSADTPVTFPPAVPAFLPHKDEFFLPWTDGRTYRYRTEPCCVPAGGTAEAEILLIAEPAEYRA